jgi:hypothetical protein
MGIYNVMLQWNGNMGEREVLESRRSKDFKKRVVFATYSLL